MINFVKSTVYLALLSFSSFLLGRILPKSWFRYNLFPFKDFKFEKSGKIYLSTGVKKWKSKVPDMSTIMSFLIPSKKLPKAINADSVKEMLIENCIAEWIHYLLAVLGFGCVFIWENIGGWIVSVLYAIGNLPYIIIQRYNRPKLVRLLKSIEQRG